MILSRQVCRRAVLWLAALAFVGAAALTAAPVLLHGDLSPEAQVRSGVASELFGARDRVGLLNESRGYRALLDSVRLAPAPTLATAPLIWIERFGAVPPGGAFYLLNVFVAAAAAFVLASFARDAGTHWIVGLLFAALLVLNPYSPFSPAAGSAATGTLFFGVAFARRLTRWLRFGALRDLALAGCLLGLGSTWEPRLLALAPAALGLVVGRELRCERREAPTQAAPGGRGARRRLEAAVLCFTAPVFYAPFVWAIFNWLVFADMTHFLREVSPPPLYVWATAGAGVLALGAAALLGRFTRHAFLVPVFLAAASAGAFAVQTQTPPGTVEAAATARDLSGAQARLELRALHRYFTTRRTGRLLLVVGKPGYCARAELGDSPVLIHRLDLNPDAAAADTRGRSLYVALTESQARSWRKRLGETTWGERLLEDARFGRWRLYRVLEGRTGSAPAGGGVPS